MAIRQRVTPRFQVSTTQPVAAPVDTYVRPAPTESERLAQALAQIAPSIGRFSEEWAQRRNQEAQERGRQAARELARQGVSAAEATRQGLLPLQDNPFFRAGLEEEMGRAEAYRWHSDLVAKMQGDEAYAHLKESTNLEDFDAAAARHVQEFLKDNPLANSEYFQAGFSRIQAAYLQEQRLRFAYGIEERLGAQTDSTMHARVMQIVEDNLRNEIPVEKTAEEIKALRAQFVNLGVPPRRAEQVVIDAVAAAARAQQDPEDGIALLDLFDKVTGYGGEEESPLRYSKYGAQVFEQTRADLIVARNRAQREAEAARKAELEERRNRAILRYEQELLNNPEYRGMDILRDPEFADLPGLAGDLQASYQKFHSLRFADNEYAVRKAMGFILENPQEATDSWLRSLNLSLSTTISLRNMRDDVRRQSENGSLDRARNHPAVKEALRQITNSYSRGIEGIPREYAQAESGARMALLHHIAGLVESGEWDRMSEQERARYAHSKAADYVRQDPGILGDLNIHDSEGITWDPDRPEIGTTREAFVPDTPNQQQQQGQPQQQQQQGTAPQQVQPTLPPEAMVPQSDLGAETFRAAALGDKHAMEAVVARASQLGIPAADETALVEFILQQIDLLSQE